MDFSDYKSACPKYLVGATKILMSFSFFLLLPPSFPFLFLLELYFQIYLLKHGYDPRMVSIL